MLDSSATPRTFRAWHTSASTCSSWAPKKFPEEDGFDAFLTASGGSSNAFTTSEDTCFYFSCGVEALSAALERFGSFFEKPLFTESATEREVSAIDSEHQKNLQDDGFRLNQVLSSRANPAHPIHHFGTGTRQTLLGAAGARGAARSALQVHYGRYYRAPLMTLCIVGREPPRQLVSYAERFFSGIPGAEPAAEPPSSAWAGTPPFLEPAFDSAAEVVPTTNSIELCVSFPVVFATDKAKNQGSITLRDWLDYTPATHVGNALGHEGPQSLCALLRKRGWCTGLSAAVSEQNDSFANFSIAVELTPEGLKKRDEIVELIFGYIQLFQGLPEWPRGLLDENLQLSEAAWRCFERLTPGQAATRSVTNMQRFMDPRRYVSGGLRLRDGTGLQPAISAVLGALNPRNAIITTVSRSFQGVAKEVEPWYCTSFRKIPIRDLLGRCAAARPAPGLAIQAPNRFLPRSLELRAPRMDSLPKGVAAPPPEELRRDERWRVLFRQDTSFGVPKAFVLLELLTPYPRSDVVAAICARLYEALLVDGLTENLLYEADLAGLRFEFGTTARGVQLQFAGYDDRLLDFIRAVLPELATFAPSHPGRS